MSSDNFAPIRKQRAGEQVAQQIRQSILSGRFAPGEHLPPERILSEQFQVTRTTIREALKTLEQSKLVTIRQGEGVTVLDFNRNGSLDLLNYLLGSDGHLDPEILRSVLEARSILGTEIARLAAERATEADVAGMTSIVAQLRECGDDLDRAQQLDFELFHALTRASANVAFVFLFNSIRSLYLEHNVMFVALFGSPSELATQHEKLVTAVAAHNTKRAAKIAREYLDHGANRLLAALAELSNLGSTTESPSFKRPKTQR